MAAVVTKDHDYSGVATAQLIANHYGHLPTKLYSGIVLNNVVGGFNPYAVEHTAAMGGKIVWLPTLAAENHLAWEKKSAWAHPASTKKMRPATAVPATRDGKVLDEVKEVLDVIAKNDMVLAAGHLHVSEIWLVFEEAKRRGVKRLVVTHPEDIIDASHERRAGLTAMGAKMEHSLCMFVKESKLKILEPEDLRKHIEAAGVDNTIMSTDLGQTGNFRPLDGFRHGIALCLDLGYSRRRHPQDVLDQRGETVRAGASAGKLASRQRQPRHGFECMSQSIGDGPADPVERGRHDASLLQQVWRNSVDPLEAAILLLGSKIKAAEPGGDEFVGSIY